MQPIFLHSSFRTGSTWFWNKFRGLPRTMSFYEPFNTRLATADAEVVKTHSASDWASGHSLSKPYFLEYLPLIGGGKGVPGFHARFCLEQFVPEDGCNGNLDDQTTGYLRQLVDLARAQNKIAVFGETHSLGRIVPLRKAFGGVHLFVYRNLWDQWCSYLGQHADGRPYFIWTVAKVISANQHVPLFQELRETLHSDANVDSGPGFAGFRDEPSAFRAFLAMHFFLYMHAAESVDLTVNVSRLASDVVYRGETGRQIKTLTDLEVDLSDAVRQIGWYSERSTTDTIGEVRELVLSKVPAPLSQPVLTFGATLLDHLQTDMTLAEAFTRPIWGRFREQTSSLDHTRMKLGESEQENIVLKEDLKRNKKANAVLEEQSEKAEASLENLRRIKQQVADIEASRSWKFTAPFRSLSRRLLHRRKAKRMRRSAKARRRVAEIA